MPLRQPCDLNWERMEKWNLQSNGLEINESWRYINSISTIVGFSGGSDFI